MQNQKGSSAAHTKLLKECLVALGKKFSTGRFFRNEVGEGWFFPPWNRSFNAEDKRYLVYGLSPDTPDIVGFTSLDITLDMVGTKVAVFTGYEIKTGNAVQTSGQKNFQKILESMGGRYILVRDINDLDNK